MSLGLAHRKELQKRRSRRFWAFFKFTLFLSIVIGSSYFAYDTGVQITYQQMGRSKNNFDQQEAELTKLRIDLGKTEAELNKLQALLPNQEMQDLLQIINKKAVSGIDPGRMARLINGLTNDETCADQSQAKRFMISTPISQSADGSVSFYRGLITITGKGSPTLSENGNPEAWFDPTKPVTVTFTLPGGVTQEASGLLPLYHSVIVKNKEYRFTLISGRRSFADITVISCDI